MGSSTKTTTLVLPLFADNDKPTWRGDINDAMHKIDDAVTAAQLAQTQANADEIAHELANATAHGNFVGKSNVPIDPDSFTGTDLVKVQSSLDLALTSTRAIMLNRMFDITGGTVVLNKPGPWDNRQHIDIIGLGGGITKNDAGPMFTASIIDTGDLTFSFVKFASIKGNGTYVFDCSKLIRINSNHCSYRKVDGIAWAIGARKYLQTIRMIGDTVVDGGGYIMDCQAAYDTSMDNIVVEGQYGGLRQTPAANMFLSSVRVRDCLFENMPGSALLLAWTAGLVVDGNYFELNAGGDIVWIKESAILSATISNNRTNNALPMIKWPRTIQAAKSFTNWSERTAVHDTSQMDGDNHVDSTNDRSQTGTPNITGIATYPLTTTPPKIWVPYTPVLAGTGWAAGNGVWSRCAFTQIGSTVHFRGSFTAGTTTTFGSSIPTISLPFVCPSGIGSGRAIMLRSGASYFDIAIRFNQNANTFALWGIGTNGAFSVLTGTSPATWGTGDTIDFSGTYEVAI